MLKSPPQLVSRPAMQRWVYSGSRVLARLAGVVAFGLRIEGRERIPAEGPVLICANHQSHLDPIVVGLCSARPMNYVARESLFSVPVLRQVMQFFDAIGLDRDGNGLAGLKETLRRLKRGEMVLFFPEGSRSYDGEIAPLKGGFLTLARRAEAAVLPVGLDGAFDALPRHRCLPRLTRIAVHIGEPITAGEASALDDAAFLAEVERRLRDCHEKARKLRSEDRGKGERRSE